MYEGSPIRGMTSMLRSTKPFSPVMTKLVPWLMAVSLPRPASRARVRCRPLSNGLKWLAVTKAGPSKESSFSTPLISFTPSLYFRIQPSTMARATARRTRCRGLSICAVYCRIFSFRADGSHSGSKGSVLSLNRPSAAARRMFSMASSRPGVTRSITGVPFPGR